MCRNTGEPKGGVDLNTDYFLIVEKNQLCVVDKYKFMASVYKFTRGDNNHESTKLWQHDDRGNSLKSNRQKMRLDKPPGNS